MLKLFLTSVFIFTLQGCWMPSPVGPSTPSTSSLPPTAVSCAAPVPIEVGHGSSLELLRTLQEYRDSARFGYGYFPDPLLAPVDFSVEMLVAVNHIPGNCGRFEETAIRQVCMSATGIQVLVDRVPLPPLDCPFIADLVPACSWIRLPQSNLPVTVIRSEVASL